MSCCSLPAGLLVPVLGYLGYPLKPPSIRYLNQLIHAYIAHVPWESVTRIVKRHKTANTAACPRWPAEFWNDTLSYGTGGTCFECNLAFFSLLSALGFQGYLTINDMAENRACHTAAVIVLHGQKYLVDIAIPLHCALPIYSNRITRRPSRFHYYTVRPVGESIFSVERSHHPKRIAFTLLDTPVPLDEYQAAVAGDYEANGYFLDRVIIVKVVHARLYRFSSLEVPYQLESFDKTSRHAIHLPPDRLAQSLSEYFGLQESKISAALACLQLDRH